MKAEPSERLHAALVEAGLPVVGVSIANRDDKSTWRVDLSDETRRGEASAIVSAFDISAPVAEPEPKPTIEDLVAVLLPDQKAALDALVADKAA